MRAILCICALAIIFEAVIGLPYVDTDNEFDDVQDMTKRAVDLLAPSSHYLLKRDSSLCPVDCFSCAKFIRDVIPKFCVQGCKRLVGGSNYSVDRKMWNRCATFLSRPLAR